MTTQLTSTGVGAAAEDALETAGAIAEAAINLLGGTPQYTTPTNAWLWVPAGTAWLPIQFNPDTLTITYRTRVPNSVAGSPPAPTSSETPSFTVTLLFDTTEDGSDVTLKTKPITNAFPQYAPQSTTGAAPAAAPPSAPASPTASLPTGLPGSGAASTPPPPPPNPVPTDTYFHWGRFDISGMLTNCSESRSFFSPDGTALRSELTLTISVTNQADKPPDPSTLSVMSALSALANAAEAAASIALGVANIGEGLLAESPMGALSSAAGALGAAGGGAMAGVGAAAGAGVAVVGVSASASSSGPSSSGSPDSVPQKQMGGPSQSDRQAQAQGSTALAP